MKTPFRDRSEAGKFLAEELTTYANKPNVIVLALPRGGVPVGAEVARKLNAPLDVFVVRKLGLPGHAELAMGAIASGGVRVLNGDVVNSLRIPNEVIDTVTAEELRELKRRERSYRDDLPPPKVEGKTVIIVDDGVATGSTMIAAVAALRQLGASHIVVAAPTIARSTYDYLKRNADDVAAVVVPEEFYGVGQWYEDFSQTTDKEVQALLGEMNHKSRLRCRMSVLADRVSKAAEPLAGSPEDYDSLLDLVGDARFVLIGEASHGTHEFYRERALISKRLIYQRGFNAVAVEADWPDAYRINRFVRGASTDIDSVDALGGFKRFPQWMWRNADVLDFVGWLREHNDEQPFENRKCGFYGLDLYSLNASIEGVLAYLTRVDPDAAKRAREHYSCFEHFGEKIETYGYAAGFGLAPTCEDAVVQELVALRRKAIDYLQRDGQVAADAYFFAEQNAVVVRNAEQYYRTMFRRDVSSWNLRDNHMLESLISLEGHLRKQGTPAKIIVWAHNSHLGDARATQMSERGELNLGQLVRERFGKEAVLIGCTTYSGSVTAASNWDEPAERKNVRPAHPESYEALFHDVDLPRFYLDLRRSDISSALRAERLERAIGVIYRPETELISHYFNAHLSDQFDAVLHFDHTRAVEPLEPTAEWQAGEVEETFPSGL